jgi:uncharacterized membrane protein HdeD (DUF308 family)
MESLARNWWLLIVRGVAAVAFGVLTLIWPGKALATLVLLFGLYALIEGVTSAVLAIMRAENQTGTWVLHAIVGIGAGIITFVYPHLTAIGLYAVIAGWAVATGVIEIMFASQMKNVLDRVGWIAFSGVASILFGVLLILFPATGVTALVVLIAAYAISSGIAWLVAGARLRRLLPRGGEPSTHEPFTLGRARHAS